MGRMNKNKFILLGITIGLLIVIIGTFSINNQKEIKLEQSIINEKELCENIKQNYPEKLGFYVELNEIEVIGRDRFLKECENGY